jgi:hypothetical protein
MPGGNIESKLSDQWRLVKEAPVPYVAGLLVLGGLIFSAFQWGYGRIIEQRDAEISVLKGRLSAVEADRNDLRKKLEDYPGHHTTPSRDADSLYQYGEAVAQAPSGQIDRPNGIVRFTRVIGAPTFDVNAAMDYRQFTLTGCQYGTFGSTSNFGSINIQMFADLTCRIAGLHP